MQRKRVGMAIMLLLLLGAAACDNNTMPDEIEGEWLLESATVDGSQVELPDEVAARNGTGAAGWFLFETSGAFQGKGPCNDISGLYDATSGELVTTSVISSAAACFSANVETDIFLAVERTIFDTLTGTPSITTKGAELELSSDSVVLTFRRSQ